MPRNLAKTLIYICQVDECRSIDIEKAADLRQPEVSIAMNELRDRGWVSKYDLKKKGKGRPVHVYTPTTNLKDILDQFEQEKMTEMNDIKTNISALRESIDTL